MVLVLAASSGTDWMTSQCSLLGLMFVEELIVEPGDQWRLLILEDLELGTQRFNALMRQIGIISKQMLSRTLKKLEQDGFITRTLYPEVPPRVEYTLTPLGRSFLEPMQQLVAWADTHRTYDCGRSRSVSGHTGANLKCVPTIH